LHDEFASGRGGIWARLFLASTSLWAQLRAESYAVRLTFAPGAPLTSVHSFVVDKSHADRLRMVLAAFMRTDRIAAGETDTLTSAADFVYFVGERENARVCICYEPLKTSTGHNIHYNIRLADHVGQLISDAAGLNLPFSYECLIRESSLPREALRAALYDVAHFQDAGAAPERLVRDQVVLADRLKRTGFNAEECLASPAGAAPLAETLAHTLQNTIYEEFAAAPRVIGIAAERATCFEQLVHPQLLRPGGQRPAPEAVGTAATREEVGKVLACDSTGLANFAARLAPTTSITSAPLAEAGRTTGAPLIQGTPGGPYLFVSYARNDSDRVYPIVRKLQQAGASLWIDQRLVLGDQWLDELEQRLNHCHGVLAFVSSSFVESRYCGREIRYADALQRTILPVLLSHMELTGGLRFILQQLQRIILSPQGEIDPILAAIEKLLPSCISGDGR
jgi:TIR domain